MLGTVEVPAGAVAADGALAGILSFCPTLILSVVRLLYDRRALTVVLNFVEIEIKVSPDCTV